MPSRPTSFRINLALALVGTATMLEIGCGGPYKNPPETLRPPAKKKRPADAASFEEQCKTDFYGPNSTVRVRRQEAETLVTQGNALVDASDDDRAGLAGALAKYRGALLANPYQAEATFRMAVVYAQLRKKGCALALLKRLGELERHPDYADDATRLVQAALGESAFEPFRDEANAAVGR